MSKNTLDELFEPKSIAIVGASNKPGKVGTVIAENISKLGYKGKIYYVNPSYKILKLKKCYPSISAIGKNIDLAVISVPSKFVLDVVKESMHATKNFVVITAGFSEIGEEGAKREKELAALAKKNNLNILGPNCLGFIMPKIKLNASFAGGMPKAGNIAFVSQSGALAVAIMDKANGEHLGFSHIVSVGNQMQLNEAKLLEYLSASKDVKVIGMYLEGIKNGSEFLEIAAKVSKIKPVVILKAGKTEKAQKAISSHTGALAGSDNIVDVVFEKTGVIRANDLEEFFDVLTLISFSDAPRNKQVAVVTNAGGAGVLATDAFKGKSIELADLSLKIKKAIKSRLPQEASVENPIDLLGDADDVRYKDALEILCSGVGATISLLTPQKQTPVDKIAEIVINSNKKSKTTSLSVFIGGDRVKHAINILKQNNIPNFASPERAVSSLDKYYKWSVFKKSKEVSVKKTINNDRKKKVAKIISKARDEGRNALLFAEAAEVMNNYGVSSGDFWVISAKKNSSTGIPKITNFPVVAKVDSDKVLHKTDKQGVILNIKNQGELEVAVQKIQQNFPGEQVLIQPMQQKQMELILGIKIDQIFGPVIIYGLGGIYTEVFSMVNFLIPPMSEEKIKQEIMNSKIGFFFQCFRGQKECNLDEFVKIIQGLMHFALENKDISGFDINPLFIFNDGRKASAVDIKIIL